MSETAPQIPSRLHIWSACLGNLFEHYDMALFGLLSPFLAPLFFPEYDAASALILTYGIIPLGMLARPVGALFFGFLGNHYGRRVALFLTLMGMGVVSGVIALTPTHAQAGLAAPVLLGLGRLLQNFFAGGEIIGGAVFVLEHTHEKRHDIMSSLYAASTVAGILLASAAVSALYFFDVMSSGWRLLYLAGSVTVLCGSLLRLQIPLTESPQHQRLPKGELLRSLWRERLTLTAVIMASGFAYSTYSIALVLMNGFIPLVSEISRAEAMALNTILLVLDLAALPLFGMVAERFSRTKMMAAAAACAAVSGVPLFLMLEGATLGMAFGVRICMVILGVWFSAVFHSWSQHLIPASHRYLIISFGYAIGTQLLGSPTAAISMWLYHSTGIAASAAWYWMLLAAATSCWILMAERSSLRRCKVRVWGE